MPFSFTFNGTEPVEVLVRALEEFYQPTVGDIMFVLNRQKTRILRRTSKGVDINENAFAQYSENPFYWYPKGRSIKTHAASKADMRRQSSQLASVRRTAKKLGSGRVTRGGGIRFDGGYREFKRSLGRTVVDLMGPNAPHMLQAIVVKVGGRILDKVSNLVLVSGLIDAGRPERATEGTIGIYGPEAERADGHNNGTGHLPKREFFGFSGSDQIACAEDFQARVVARGRRFLQ